MKQIGYDLTQIAIYSGDKAGNRLGVFRLRGSGRLE